MHWIKPAAVKIKSTIYSFWACFHSIPFKVGNYCNSNQNLMIRNIHPPFPKRWEKQWHFLVSSYAIEKFCHSYMHLVRKLTSWKSTISANWLIIYIYLTLISFFSLGYNWLNCNFVWTMSINHRKKTKGAVMNWQSLLVPSRKSATINNTVRE